MLDRFHVPELIQKSAVSLTGAEARHLRRVLRKQPGDEVTLFDGQGCEVRARIESIDQREVTLNMLGPPVRRSTTGVRVTLATAVPKGDRARWLVEKATELGAAAWLPLLTEKSVVDPRAAKLEKLQQTVIAACKQCGRNDLMQIHAPKPWREFLDQVPAESLLLVADPSGAPLGELLNAASPSKRESITVAIGPEGGFTVEELEAAHAGDVRLISLGSSILRIETAAVAALAAIRIHI